MRRGDDQPGCSPATLTGRDLAVLLVATSAVLLTAPASYYLLFAHHHPGAELVALIAGALGVIALGAGVTGLRSTSTRLRPDNGAGT